MSASNRPHAILLDSSVIVKWFVNEEDSLLAHQVQAAWMQGKIDLFYAELSLFEVGNALFFSKLFTPAEIVVALDAVYTLGMALLPMNSYALHNAIQLSYDHRITIYDAYLVALAMQNRLGFVSADRRLVQRLTSLSFIYELADYQLG
jgi:predicted nucleic acid-binding protein